MIGMANPEALARLNYELIHGLMERDHCPTNAELAAMLGAGEAELEALIPRSAP
jgi:hypothetical protein